MRLNFPLIFLLAFSKSFAQTNTAVITSNGKTVSIVDNIYGAVLPVIKPDNIEGSPFFSDDWNNGTVIIKKGNGPTA